MAFVLAKGDELGYSPVPEPLTLDGLESWVIDCLRSGRDPGQEQPRNLSVVDHCFYLAALCSSPGKEGRVLRKHGLTTEKVMEVIKRAKGGAV